MAYQAQPEFNRINDPNFVLEIAAGPPTVQLVEQQPGTGAGGLLVVPTGTVSLYAQGFG